ncbi:cytochrome c oxidase assembly protein [Paracoccus beibuensis]|uniref:cytochrome c oxidase assembly protein n=1 Tax=Paracoccus beibuensis TaxID=547602 RepID=UPI00223F282D|nr:cytochrome c oxidase assembly protein [Paracoccus beibuensis]
MRVLATVLLFLPTAALAHADHAAPVNDTWAIVPLVLGGAIYAAGLARLWRQGGPGRGITRTRAALFAGGFLLAAVLLLSRLSDLTKLLLTAHMIQHFALMLIAAPLMVLGRPGLAALWAAPQSWRGRLARAGTALPWRGLAHPLGAWITYFVVLWGWHLPPLHQAALRSDAIHAVQHFCFLGAAMLFWHAVLERPRAESRGGAFIAVFATAVQSCALAALLTTSQVLWYPAYGGGAWGLDRMQDQQLGGLIMWVPCCAIFIGTAVALMARLLSDSDRRMQRTAR